MHIASRLLFLIFSLSFLPSTLVTFAIFSLSHLSSAYSLSLSTHATSKMEKTETSAEVVQLDAPPEAKIDDGYIMAVMGKKEQLVRRFGFITILGFPLRSYHRGKQWLACSMPASITADPSRWYTA
jgi:hypothetical protein